MEEVRVQPPERSEVRVKPMPAVTVRPKLRATASVKPITTLWERAGWTIKAGPRGDVYTGKFRVRDRRASRWRTYGGRIEGPGQGSRLSEGYVQNPPPELRSHPKAACFRPVAGGWWHMNWYAGTKEVDETIAYIEQVLDEAVNRSWKGA